MIEQVLKNAASPGPEFRGAPFWAWNAKLEEGELRRQIRLMHDMGIGGFFMHSRVGLNTPYLGKEWFNCIKACIDEAKKLNMKAWLYDEDRWPSGAAGGIVTKEKRFRQRELKVSILDKVPEKYPDETIGVFAGAVNGDQVSKVRKFDVRRGKLKKGESLLVFENRERPCKSWYNDQTYLDTMSPDAVRRFIEVTHEAYRKNISGDFGKTVPGIFTDEPNYGNRPWTQKFPEKFRKTYHYSILDHLPEIFFYVDGQLFSKARLDYCNLSTSLFVNSFSRLIGEWCEKNGMLFTGHDLFEDTPVGQTQCCGAAMRFYEFQQQPGIDLLTEHWGVFDTAKQCSSMAHQFGRKWRLSESYGCTGWDFPFMGHKALGDWQFAEGINFRCQHLAWYSMAAEAKRDYPASISYQSPWFKDFRTVEDYFGRLGAALSEGEEQRDLLVIHPIESTWGACVLNSAIPADACCDTLAKDFNKEEAKSLFLLSNRLLAGNLDFDYGDEEVMSRHGKVVKNLVKVNKASYKAVLIPKLRTVRRTTLELLSKFRKAGGMVCYLGDVPEYMDGGKSPEIKKAYNAFTPVTEKTMIKTLSPASRRVSILDEAGKEIGPALYILRKAADHQTLFFCNYGIEFGDQSAYPLVRERRLEWNGVTVRLAADKAENVYELDLMSGKLYRTESTFKNGFKVFKTSLPRLGSRLFFTSAKELPAEERAEKACLTGKKLPLPSSGWKIDIDDYNVLLLDHADYSVNGKKCGRDYVLRLDDALRVKHLGCRERGGEMVQPWLNAGKKKPDKVIDLKLDYAFRCASVPEGSVYLGIERPDLYKFELNGKAFKAEDCGWWCDVSLRRIKLPAGSFRKGRNVLTLSCRYHELLPGLEMIYILGDFGVSGDLADTIVPPVRTLETGDWCKQGLPNYSGNLTYTTSFELNLRDKQPCILEFGEWRGVALAVSVNGSAWQAIPFPPFSADVTELVKNGKNVISIRVIGHRRNSHGPFYAASTWPVWTGPDEFKTYKDAPFRKLVPCGLLEVPVLNF